MRIPGGLLRVGCSVDADKFRILGLRKLETIGAQIDVQIDFRDLQVEAIIVVRPVDSQGARKSLWAACGSGRAGSLINQRLPV